MFHPELPLYEDPTVYLATLSGSSWTRTSTTTSEWVAWLLLKEELSFVVVHSSSFFSRASSFQSLMSDPHSVTERQFSAPECRFSSALVRGCCELSDATTMSEEELCPLWRLFCRDWTVSSSSLDLSCREMKEFVPFSNLYWISCLRMLK